MIELRDVLAVPWMRPSAPSDGRTLSEQMVLTLRGDRPVQGRSMYVPGSLALASATAPLCRGHDLDDRVGTVTAARDARSGWRISAVVTDPAAAAWCRSSTPPELSVGLVSVRGGHAVMEWNGEELTQIIAAAVVEVSLVARGAFGPMVAVRPTNIIEELAA
jgi:hypothetical protein